jgi:AraC-like DNA-binding protein
MQRWVRAAVLSNYFEVARQVGFDPSRMLKQTHLAPALLTDPDRLIPLRPALDLLEGSAAASGCDTFGLQMARMRKLSDFGAVSLLLVHQPTLRSALTALQRYQSLLNPTLSIHVERHDDVVVIREEFVSDYQANARQGIELALGVLFRMFDLLFAPGWKPAEAHFFHDPPSSPALHQQVFGCPLRFGSEFCGFVCSPEDLDRANSRENADMARHAQRYLETLPGSRALSMSDQVRQALRHLMPSGCVSAQEVARHLGLHVRSLQRRLEAESSAFLALQHEVRMELAARYLDTPSHSIVQIADLLGYSTPSAFSRWFTGQFGQSPKTWRSMRRTNAFST